MNKEQKAQTAQLIEQQVKIEGFSQKATRDLLRYYDNAKNKTLKDINKSIKKNLHRPSRERLQRIYDDADKMIMSLTDKLTSPVSEAVTEVGVFSYKDTARIVSFDGLAVGYNSVSRSARQISAMVNDDELGGKYLDDWLWSALKKENGALKAEIASGLLRGVGYKEMMRSLPSKYDNLLSSKKTKSDLETVTKSYVQAVNAKSHKDIYEANKHVVKKVEWSAIMENGNAKTGRGTCPRCMALDGMEYKSVDAGPPMPLHPRCRCMYLPITKTWKELGIDIEEADKIYKKWYIRSPSRKIMSTGNIDGNYADWWMTRGKDFQDSAIGPVRASMVRDGRVNFSNLVVNNKSQIRRIKKATGTTYKYGELIDIDDLALWKKLDISDIRYKRKSPMPVFSNSGNVKMTVFEDSVRGNNYETGMLFNSNGKMIVEQQGRAHSVLWKAADLKKARGGVLTHNHPGGGSFSTSDIRVMRDFSLGEIRAAGVHSGGHVDYSAKLIGRPPKLDSSVNASIERAVRKARDETDKMFGDKAITVDEANFRLYHRVWQIFEAENIDWFKYKRTIK